MNEALKGGILVAVGASSYGMLTTIVKLAYEEGYRPAEVTFAQLFIGCIALFAIHFILKLAGKSEPIKSKKSIPKLILAGTTIGLTSTFYYKSVQYIDVSIGIVLLMQSVWLGVLLEAIIARKLPSGLKIISVIVILLGTLLATNVLFESTSIHPLGLMWGLLAAVSFTLTIFATNQVGLDLQAIVRSKWMMLGGLGIVTLVAMPVLFDNFNMGIFIKWGPLLALFGTVIPPLFFNLGMPKINVGLGSIVASLELPVAVTMAYIILSEQVNGTQWLGIFMIIAAVIIMNIRKIIKPKKTV